MLHKIMHASLVFANASLKGEIGPETWDTSVARLSHLTKQLPRDCITGCVHHSAIYQKKKKNELRLAPLGMVGVPP